MAFKNVITHMLSIDLGRLYNSGFVTAIVFSVQIMSGALLALVLSGSGYWGGIGGFYFFLWELYDTEYSLLSDLHVIGSSFIFSTLYLHALKSMVHDAWCNQSILMGGIGLLMTFVTIAVGFLGYMIPMSSLSYWGLSVASSLLAAVPFFGSSIQLCFWGGEWISITTVLKVQQLHYFLAFSIVALIVLHFVALHMILSTDQAYDRLSDRFSLINFYCISSYRDVMAMSWVALLFSIFFLNPHFMSHEEAWEIFDPLKTPSKILPEWYFLFMFGVLKSIPSKLGGIFITAVFMLGLVFLFQYTIYNVSGLGLKPFRLTGIFTFLFLLMNMSYFGAVVILVFPLQESALWFTLFTVSSSLLKML